MGACAFDIEKQGRKLTTQYEVTDPKSIAELLRDYYYIAERRFHRADYAGCDLLIDLERAIDKAHLSRRQRQAIELWKEEYNHNEGGKAMGITRQTFSEYVDDACEKIAKIFESWEACE